MLGLGACMLKMKCPQCQEMIVSALLSDMEQIPCEHCHEIVPVTDVMVFAEGFTFHRNDLIKRLFRYKTLLTEINKERELLEKSPGASDEGKKSLGRFAQALAEVMAGARNNLRIDFADPVPLRFKLNAQNQMGNLVNLSTSGACIALNGQSVPPKKKIPLTVEFLLPGCDYPFALPGTVSWVKKGGTIGVEFNTLEQECYNTLWEFISTAVEG